jgi:hypothetical protein
LQHDGLYPFHNNYFSLLLPDKNNHAVSVAGIFWQLCEPENE